MNWSRWRTCSVRREKASEIIDALQPTSSVSRAVRQRRRRFKMNTLTLVNALGDRRCCDQGAHRRLHRRRRRPDDLRSRLGAGLRRHLYRLPPTLPVPNTGVNCRITTTVENGTGAVIVAFRGSVTAEDWARDFICAPVGTRADPQFGLCHAGFLDAAQSIVDAVEAEIGTPAKSFPVYMAGHLARRRHCGRRRRVA